MVITAADPAARERAKVDADSDAKILFGILQQYHDIMFDACSVNSCN